MNCEFNLQPATAPIAQYSTRNHRPVALTCIGTALFVAFLSSCTTTGEQSMQDMHADGTEHTQASETPGKHAKQHNMENTTTPKMKHDEGHAHLFIDGKKIGRVYSNWYHINPLRQGSHTIRVTLNANDHSELALIDKPLDATLTIVQK